KAKWRKIASPRKRHTHCRLPGSDRTPPSIERWKVRPTSKMSHDGIWRASCNNPIRILRFHLERLSRARGVTGPGVGSSALLGLSEYKRCEGENTREKRRGVKVRHHTKL